MVFQQRCRRALSGHGPKARHIHAHTRYGVFPTLGPGTIFALPILINLSVTSGPYGPEQLLIFGVIVRWYVDWRYQYVEDVVALPRMAFLVRVVFCCGLPWGGVDDDEHIGAQKAVLRPDLQMPDAGDQVLPRLGAA